MFFIAFFIIAAACSIITIKTLVGYSDMSFVAKLAIAIIVILGWLSPIMISSLRNITLNYPQIFSFISKYGYTLFGFVFVVFCLLILRDIFWYALYGSAQLMGIDNWYINPKNISVLGYANLIVICLSMVICGYGLYEANKTPNIVNISDETSRINRDWRIVQISDLHINRTTAVDKIRNLVETVNSLGPDVIVLTGDIFDDDASVLQEQISALGHIGAPYGVYASVGNHEFYNGLSSWLYQYEQLGFTVLFNKGVSIGGDIFIAGIPDAFTASSNPVHNVNFTHTLAGSTLEQYKILLSHNPELADSISSFNFQMMLSGHTHGGQIFPFHIFVKKANRYLSGDYNVNGIKLHVSNGAGTWGPAMRILAPSEITVIDLIKKYK